MENKVKFRSGRHNRKGIFFGTLLILLGVLFLGVNAGWICQALIATRFLVEESTLS